MNSWVLVGKKILWWDQPFRRSLNSWRIFAWSEGNEWLYLEGFHFFPSFRFSQNYICPLLPPSIYSSLLPFTLPWIPLSLSVVLINLLSPTTAIHLSIRTHSHPSTCFSVYLYDLSFHSFFLLLVPKFILCLDLILILYNRYFYPHSYFWWLIYSEDIYKYHRGQQWRSLMIPWRWSKHLILFEWY